MVVALPAAPAPGHADGLAGLQQLRQELAAGGVPEHGAQGHVQHQALTVAAGTEDPGAGPAAPGAEGALVAEGVQGVQALVGPDGDGSAQAAVAAVGTALLGEFLAPEAGGPGAAVAGFQVERQMVKEHGLPIKSKERADLWPRAPTKNGVDQASRGST